MDEQGSLSLCGQGQPSRDSKDHIRHRFYQVTGPPSNAYLKGVRIDGVQTAGVCAEGIERERQRENRI